MAQASHSVTVPVSQEKVWSFVSNIEKWAKLVPGYKEHKMIDDKKSVWTFEGNMKGISKTIEMELNIVEFVEPSNIKVEITGISDKFTGSGQFQAEPEGNGTKMTGTVEVNAGILLAPMIKMVLPKVTTRLTEKIGRTLQN